MRESIIRTLALNAALGYSPTRVQLLLGLDVKDSSIPVDHKIVLSVLDELKQQNLVVEFHGRLALFDYQDQIEAGRLNELFFPRKLRRARWTAGYLSKLPWVRAVSLCNTTALGQARDGGDLDFLVIVKAGTIWRSRFFSALPFALLNARPAVFDKSNAKKDPVCLSFFITDENLNLWDFSLPEDDPYLRHWFLSLMPLKDDGVMCHFWDQNHVLRQRHPLAKPWIALSGHDYSAGGKLKYSLQNSWLEGFLKRLQWKRFPKVIREMANQDTRVVINDRVLKFHVQDQREKFRQDYRLICQKYGVDP